MKAIRRNVSALAIAAAFVLTSCSTPQEPRPAANGMSPDMVSHSSTADELESKLFNHLSEELSADVADKNLFYVRREPGWLFFLGRTEREYEVAPIVRGSGYSVFVGKNGLVEMVVQHRLLFAYSLGKAADEAGAKEVAREMVATFHFTQDEPEGLAVTRYVIVSREDPLVRYHAIPHQLYDTFGIYRWTTSTLPPFGEEGE